MLNYSILCETQSTGANNWSGIIMIVVLIAIFYFMMIRPQQKKQKEIRKFRESLSEGSKIVTAGGIHGKITGVKEYTFMVKIANDTVIEIDKGSVYEPASAPAQSK